MNDRFKLIQFFILIVSLVLFQANAATNGPIDITLDIDGVDQTPSTTSRQVFVERVELSFPNNRPTQSINLNSKGFYAKARFKYVGNGALRARWLVDDRVVSQHLVNLTFGKTIEIRSDQNNSYLPSFERGYHTVSLELINSAGVIDRSARAIRYFVTEGVESISSDDAPVLLFPKNRKVDARQFYFRWKGNKQFRAYRLELERLVAKQSSTQAVFKALSKIDVFAPSDKQREYLKPGRYRWRIKAFHVSRKTAATTSAWATFEIAQGALPKALLIRNISVVDTKPTDNVRNIRQLQLSSQPLNKTTPIINKSKMLIGKGRISSGAAYQLQLDVQNSSSSKRDDALAEVRSNGALIGRYPLGINARSNTSISIPLQADSSERVLHQSLSIQLIGNNRLIDEAAVNLTIEPRLRLDALDFNEVATVQGNDFPITDPHRCAVGEADRNMAFSRLVSAQLSNQVSSPQSLLQQGYFSFDAGQQVRFKAFFKDKGLGAWFDGPSGSCVRKIGKRSVIYRNHPLQFVAQPLNELGQPQGSAFAIGEVTFTSGFEGILTSPLWTIPAAGQYRISLNQLSDPADLYATLPGGFPKYIHAAGFISELQTPLLPGSALTSLSPRQAVLNGRAITRWRGDVNGTQILLDFNQLMVTMDNPLHARLSGGEMRLNHAANRLVPRLRLYGETHQLLDLTLSLRGATARLDYQIPDALATASSSKVVFDDVAIMNGGEFVAMHEFPADVSDLSFTNDDLALRLRGSTLVVDASPRLSYTAYAQQAAFTGIGVHKAMLRVRVNRANGLFSVENPQNAFLYGEAKWLTLQTEGFSAEHIKVKPAQDISPFFNQQNDDNWHLLQPYGFAINISGGEFGLQQSVVGGVNLAGSVHLINDNTSAMTGGFYFEHLVRDSRVPTRFVSEHKQNKSLNIRVDGFEYQPALLQLLIGVDENLQSEHPLPGRPDTAEVQGLDYWKDLVVDVLKQKSGLLALDGKLDRGWQLMGDSVDVAITRGAFLLTANGLKGQWNESGAQVYDQHFEINGFDTSIAQLWLQFEDSVLTDSRVEGRLNIPYPVAQGFPFRGTVDQQGDLWIPRDGVSFPASGEIPLSYWRARLKNNALPVTATQAGTAQLGITSQGSAIPIIYNREQQRLELNSMQLYLEVDEETLGGAEFVSENGAAPFVIDTDIMADGQLAQTRVSAGDAALFFIGQPFVASDIKFAPYFNTLGDADSTIATRQALVEVSGEIFFQVFGAHQIKINHTALGAQVPQISTLTDGNYGEGAIRVNAQLKFINSFAANADIAAQYLQQAQSQANAVVAASGGGQPTFDTQPFKAFVGTADLVLINAVSIRGLAEAGLHQRQPLVDGRWTVQQNGPTRAYERIGLGLGADIVKATIAGLHGLETVTQLGGALVSAAAGVEGTGEQVVKLGTDAVTFVESVGVAVAASVGSGGGASPEVIRSAVGSGLDMTESGIVLLKLICQDRPDCSEDQVLLLDISSLLVRVAGSLTQFEELAADPQKMASIALQTLDVGIPLMMGVNLDAAYAMTGAPPLQVNATQITLNDKKNAALSVAHVMVSTTRTLVDNDLSIPFNDFLRISRKTVDAARNLQAVQGVEAGLNGLGLAQAKQLMALSFDLADRSIDLAQGFKGNRSTQNLGQLANQFVELLCQQSDALLPLMQQAGVSADMSGLLQSPLGLTKAVLNNTSADGLPTTTTATARFLQQMLTLLANADGNLQGCGAGSLQVPAAARAVLKIAAHSLQPLDGSLVDNVGAQIGWALQSVNLSVETLDQLAPQIGLNQLPGEITEIQQVLQRLAQLFTEMGAELTPTEETTISTQAVLRLAQGIPAAMRELVVQRGAGDAAEILDLHIVLMRELAVLLQHKDEISAGNLDNVDLFALPTALMQEMQDLSQLTQCQRSGLSNLAMILSIARAMGQPDVDPVVIIDQLDQLYQNVQACDQTGISQTPQLAQFMQIMQLMRSLAQNPAAIQTVVNSTLPRLLPVFIDNASQMASSIGALSSALPIADFTRNDTTAVLDEVLNRLLNEAQQRATGSHDLAAIRKARSIINHADLNMTGLTLTRDDSGRVTALKQLRADGSMRQLEFITAGARQFYPEGHPDFNGGLDEYLLQMNLPVPGDFDQLAAADRASLFTPFWDQLFEQGEVYQRAYKDSAGNQIKIDTSLDDLPLVRIFDAVSYAAITPNRLFRVSRLPARKASAETIDEMTDSLLQAEVYRPYGSQNPACSFTAGCVYALTLGQGYMSVRSVSNPHEQAVYTDNRDKLHTLAEIKPEGSLMQFSGYLDTSAFNWNPAWRVNYQNTGMVSIKQGDSEELLQLDDTPIESPVDIASLVNDAERFMQRVVVNGDDIWRYIPGQNALHRFGDGNWAVYRMPMELAAGTAVPAPTQTIALTALELLARGDRNGIIEDPANLSGGSAAASSQNELVITGDNSDQTITIALSGASAGSIMVGQTDLAVAASSGIASSQIESTTTQADGSQLVTQQNGDTRQLRGSADDNLIITQTTTTTPRISPTGLTDSVYQRQVRIRYCKDKNQSWALCPANQRSDQSFQYDWFTDASSGVGYVDIDLAQRPVITPVSGINRAIKHQFWRDIFALEQTLLQAPSIDGLDQLSSLISRAADAGLPIDELTAQQGYIAARIINLLMIEQFNLHDQYISDLSKQNDWKNNPDASPRVHLAKLADRLKPYEMTVNNNYRQKRLELLTLNYRLYLQDLQAFDISGGNLQISNDLAHKISGLLDVMADMIKLDANEQNYQLDVVCQQVDQVKQYIQQDIIDNPGYVVLQSDVQMALNIEATGQQLGCASDNTMLTEVAGLAARMGNSEGDWSSQVQAARLQTLAQAIVSQNSDTIDYNHDGALDAQDVVYYYLTYLMRVDNVNNPAAPTPQQFSAWAQHIQNIDRLIGEINDVKNSRGGNVYYHPAAVVALKQQLTDQLRAAWQAEYQRLREQFVVQSETTALGDLTKLATFYETSHTLNTRLQGIIGSPLIVTDSNRYLRVKVNGSWVDPIDSITRQQSVWIDRLWLQTPESLPDFAQIVDQLNSQDYVITYLQDSLPAGELGALKRLDERVTEKLNSEMGALAATLAEANNSNVDQLDATVAPIRQIRQLLNRLQLADSRQQFQQRVQSLLDDAVSRVKNDFNRTTQELRAIMAISLAYDGLDNLQISDLVDNGAIRDALHEAGVNALYALESGGDLEDIKAFLNIVSIERELGSSNPEWNIRDVYPRMQQLIGEAENELQASNDPALVPAYIDLLGQAQSIGMDTGYNFDAAISVLDSNRDILTGCIQTQNCTISHVRGYIELTAGLAAMGGDSSDLMAQIETMSSSSPATMGPSIRNEAKLPDLEKLVKRDKTGNNGRRSAATVLQRLGNGLSIADAAGRKALRLLISHLKRLASMSVPVGHVKPPAALDPLLQAAARLQQKIDQWLAQLTQQIEQRQAEQNGTLLTSNPDDISQSLGISIEELEQVAQTQNNAENSDQPRVVAGNKYRLAAEALLPVSNLESDAELRLSVRLLSNLPDPQITTEGDYRLAAIAQLALYVLDSAGDVLPSAADAQALQQSPLGDLVYSLLTLPAQQRPASKLLEFSKRQILPSLTGQNNPLDCSSVEACLLGGGLQLSANVLDSILLTTQQNPSLDGQADALLMLQSMAQNIAQMAQSDSSNPLVFWTGMGAQALNLSLQLVTGSSNDTNLLLAGLTLSRQMLQSPDITQRVIIMSQNIPQAAMAYQFVNGSTGLLIEQLQQQGDQHLPIAIARMAGDRLFATLQQFQLDPRLVEAGQLLTNWQLDLADQDNAWGLMTSGNTDPAPWLDLMMGEGGVAVLNGKLNDSGLLQGTKIPATLGLTPFIATRSLLNNQAILQDPQQQHKVLADLAADLSNSWFLPLDYRGGFDMQAENRAANDKPIAIMLRQIKTIDSNDNGGIKALKLVGNTGLGAIQAILPGTALSQVMKIAWNGGNNGQDAGIVDAIDLGMQGSNVDVTELLILVQQIPATTADMLTAINNGAEDDPTARLLRILSVTTRPGDLLPPDQPTNPVFDSMLVSLGEVRKLVAPMLSNNGHNTHASLGYLKTVPFITLQGGQPVLSTTASFAADMQEMVDLAISFNANNSLAVVQKVSLGGVDIARLGINALAPLFDNGVTPVSGLSQRAIFDDLVAGADSPGFSGVSGGLQMEWEPASTTARKNSELVLEMFGQLAFPLLGKQKGLMQMIFDSGGHYLFFESEVENDSIADLAGSVEGGIKAELRAMDRSLSLAYWGKSKLEILSNTIAGVEAAGVIGNFPDPAAASDPLQYAERLLSDITIAQCAALETQILPFPLSLTGIGATATLGGYAEKEGLSLTSGGRIGLSGSLKFPGLNSLLGMTLRGNITTQYSAALDPGNGRASGSSNSCIAPRATLTLLGQSIELGGSDIEGQTSMSGKTTSATTDVKLKLSLNSGVVSEILEGGGCSNPFDVVAQGLCTALRVMSQGSLWMVIRGSAATSGGQGLLIFGMGEFPPAGGVSKFPYLKASISSEGTLSLIDPLSVNIIAGSWGGWDSSQGKFSQLCRDNLCELNSFRAAPASPR